LASIDSGILNEASVPRLACAKLISARNSFGEWQSGKRR